MQPNFNTLANAKYFIDQEFKILFAGLPAIILLTACGSKIKETKDSVYSRHLQKHIELTIISTPVPEEKNSFNLLLLNDGQDIEKLG